MGILFIYQLKKNMKTLTKLLFILLFSLCLSSLAKADTEINKKDFLKTIMENNNLTFSSYILDQYDPFFKDVPKTNEYYSYIQSAVILKIIPEESYFYPNSSIRRDEAAKYFVKAYDLETNVSGGPHFQDIATYWWTYDYIETLYNNNIVKIGDGYFYPLSKLTEEDFSSWQTRTDPNNVISEEEASKADIVIDRVEIEKKNLNKNISYVYKVYVKNIGDEPADPFKVSVEISPDQPQAIGNSAYSCTDGFTKNVPNNYLIYNEQLEPGQEELLFDYFNPVISGDITISAKADSTDVISESNEDNNDYLGTFSVIKLIEKTKCPELCNKGSCEAGEDLPDLVIDRIEITKNTSLGDQQAYNFAVYVKNIGAGNADLSKLKITVSPSQAKKLITADSLKYTCLNTAISSVPNNYLIKDTYLAPGEEEAITNYINPVQSGTISINAEIDYDDEIIEENEDNNTLAKSFYVKALGDADYCPNLCQNNQCGATEITDVDLILKSLYISKSSDGNYAANMKVCMDGEESLADLGFSSTEFSYTIYDEKGEEYTQDMGSSAVDYKNGRCATILWDVQADDTKMIDNSGMIKVNLDPEDKITETAEDNNSIKKNINTSCTPVGGIMSATSGSCCEGLVITNKKVDRDGACKVNIYKQCIACGDGYCGTGEDECNCPKDCSSISSSSESSDEVETNDIEEVSDSYVYEEGIRTAVSGEIERTFPDMTSNTKEAEAAAELYNRNIINGFADGEFKGDALVNRAEAAKFLLLARDGAIEDTENDGSFSDVSAEDWFSDYIMKAHKEGIIEGYDNGKFKPSDPVNTAEFLKMLSLTFDLELNLDYSYQDVNSSDWYAPYAGIGEQYELFPDRTENLNPEKELTRNEVAVAIYSLLTTIEK